MKVLILKGMVSPKIWKDRLNKLNSIAKLNIEFIIPERYNNELILKYIEDVEVVVTYALNSELFYSAKKIKLIQIPSVGVDKLDFSIIRNRPNIFVCNMHANKISVAEHVMGFILALAKKIVLYDRDLRNGKWHGYIKQEPVSQIFGKNIGIIGLGSVGWEIAKIAKKFNMNIYAIKRKIKKSDISKKKILNFLGERKDLKEVIINSKFIVLCVPLTKETRNLISEKELKLMKGKYLINVARAPVINEVNLYESLEKNILAGAALDPWNRYPNYKKKNILPSKYDFHKLDNVILSPHTAGYTYEALEENIKGVFKNIVKIYSNQRPDNCIDIHLEY